jgi:hypothetical protein
VRAKPAVSEREVGSGQTRPATPHIALLACQFGGCRSLVWIFGASIDRRYCSGGLDKSAALVLASGVWIAARKSFSSKVIVQQQNHGYPWQTSGPLLADCVGGLPHRYNTPISSTQGSDVENTDFVH